MSNRAKIFSPFAALRGYEDEIASEGRDHLNADGGDAAIGIEDDGTITGIDGQDKRINELLRAPLDYCVPSVSVDSEVVNCTDAKGQSNHILIMHVFPSPQVHANQADEVYQQP